jgi:hypothetical protein
MTYESLRLAAEFSSTLSIPLAAALAKCNSFSQSQFDLYFLFILIMLCLLNLCINNALYLRCFKDYFETLYKYNRTYFVIYTILEYSPAILELVSTIPGTTDNMNYVCWFAKIIPMYFHREILPIAGYPREESHDSPISKISNIKSRVHSLRLSSHERNGT